MVVGYFFVFVWEVFGDIIIIVFLGFVSYWEDTIGKEVEIILGIFKDLVFCWDFY